MDYPIDMLAADTWVDGELVTNTDVQWFKFTPDAVGTGARAGKIFVQFNVISFSTAGMDGVDVQLCDSDGMPLEDVKHLSWNDRFTSWDATAGATYYIQAKLRTSVGGTYSLCYSTAFFTPNPPELTQNAWTAGTIASANNGQWFHLTGTGGSLPFYKKLADYLMLKNFDASGGSQGSGNLNAANGTTNAYPIGTAAGDNYLFVKAYDPGDFQIGLSEVNFAPPGIVPITLGVWADGNLASEDDTQWFKYYAYGPESMFIHFAAGTLVSDTSRGIDIQCYDSNGDTVGSSKRLNYPDASVASFAPSAAGTYYFKVTRYNNSGGGDSGGTYRLEVHGDFAWLGAIELQSGWLASTPSITGNITPQWYRTSSSTTGTMNLTIEFLSLNNAARAYAYVYNTDGDLITGFPTLPGMSALSPSASITFPTLGTYWVLVSWADWDGTSGSGQYNIKLAP